MHPIRFFIAIASGVGISALGLAFAIAVEGCSGDEHDATTGKRVLLHTKVTLEAAARSRFTTELGWDVTLSKAAIAAGPFYYFDGTPPLVLNAHKTSWQYASRWLGLGVAHAHPGHYQAGNAMGEMREASSLDLLGGAADFADGEGVSGLYRSARFTIAKPQGPAKAALNGHSIFVEGFAEKTGEEPRAFRAFADLADVETQATLGQIEGCDLTKVMVEADGTVTATVDARVWFDLVDFTTAAPAGAEAPADLPADSDAQIAFVLGVTQLSAYKFSYTAD